MGEPHKSQDDPTISYDGNFGEPVTFNSLQVNTRFSTGVRANGIAGIAEMDIGQGNPASAPVGTAVYGIRYIYNKIFSTDNSYGCMK